MFKVRRLLLGWVDGRCGWCWAGLVVDAVGVTLGLMGGAAAYDYLLICLCAAVALHLPLVLAFFPLLDGRVRSDGRLGARSV